MANLNGRIASLDLNFLDASVVRDGETMASYPEAFWEVEAARSLEDARGRRGDERIASMVLAMSRNKVCG
jgi:hypothetical protein